VAKSPTGTVGTGGAALGSRLVALAIRRIPCAVLAVPTVPVGDFATYRESANYLLEFGSLDPGFIYMPVSSCCWPAWRRWAAICSRKK